MMRWPTLLFPCPSDACSMKSMSSFHPRSRRSRTIGACIPRRTQARACAGTQIVTGRRPALRIALRCSRRSLWDVIRRPCESNDMPVAQAQSGPRPSPDMIRRHSTGSETCGELLRDHITLFASAWDSDEDGKKAIQDAMSEPAKMYGPDQTDTAGPSFIHLKKATVRSPSGSLPSNDGMLWRGRLTEVSGFMLGSIG